MKTRYSTIDIIAAVTELQSLLHYRVINVYDIDHKTYLFKLHQQEEKAVLLIESGSRLNKTEYEWPKNPAPSGFTMKLRKHVHNRRLESIKQLGIDRIVDLQFGSNEAAYHVILELYDKGNIVLTDYEYTILNILRPRTENENVRFLVHEKYPVDHAKQPESPLSVERLREIVLAAKEGDNLKKLLNPHLECGPAVIDHVLLGANFPEGAKVGKGFKITEDIPRLMSALEEAETLLFKTKNGEFKGIITQKQEKRPKSKTDKESAPESYCVYNEFHPHLFRQHEKGSFVEFSSFTRAVDDFFSQVESQKLDLKAIQQEKDALKKLENVKKDHEQRIDNLQKAQEVDKWKAELIEVNLDLVQEAIFVVQNAIANQVDWKEISALIQEAAQQGDRVAKAIKTLKLDINHFTMLLSNPFSTECDSSSDENDDGVEEPKKIDRSKPVLIDIDLDLSAYANAKKYYDKKRFATKKEQKTIESSAKAFKSAEKKTKQTLKDVATVTSINKARRTHWFEKFLWFISSENYLVIGGHDQQQNEIVVKRYLRPGDVYVHADLHGATSIVIKNRTPGMPIPPKTLNEAGTMAVCSSAAWESKVVTSAWWVHPDQVSKTAPTGEYLTTGSFMVRGKKNYLPPCYLVMGFGFLFRLDDESIPNHKDERRVKTTDDAVSFSESTSEADEEVPLGDSSDSNSDEEGDPEKLEEESKEKKSDILRTVLEESIDTEKTEGKSDSEEVQITDFPDTVIELEHVHGDQFLMKPRQVKASQSTDEHNVIYLGDEQPVVIKSQNKKPNKQKIKFKTDCEPEDFDQGELSDDSKKSGGQSSAQAKRGHKYKLKKMKEKYRDQDEDERELAMSILQSAGTKEPKKGKKGGKDSQQGIKAQVNKRGQAAKPTNKQNINQPNKNSGNLDIGDVKQAIKTETKKEADEDQGSDDEKEAKQQAVEDAQLLDSLTGIPIVEDVLLYAVPVCAPYNSIVNYKFKVKLTPGSGKRGKAGKMALNMFLHDKTASTREKDLFKSVKDQDISRNLPGKVKLSAPQLLKHKKKR